MRIEFSETVEVNSHVHIGSDEIAAMLDEKLIDTIVCVTSDSPTDRTKAFMVGEFVSDIYSVLKGTTDEMINAVSDENKKLIAIGLQEQADRWQTDKS